MGALKAFDGVKPEFYGLAFVDREPFSVASRLTA
jgi:hypothetical protein